MPKKPTPVEKRKTEITPYLEPEAIDYYYDRCYEFVMDNIIWPARIYMNDNDIAPTNQQKALMDAVSKYKRVSIESGHGSGKSTSFSWVGEWYVATRHNTLGYPVKVPVLAPTFHQLYDVIWPEFKRWVPMSRLSGFFKINMTEVFVLGHKDSSFIRARSPKIPNHLQGWHAQHLLVIADEAFEIKDEEVWETIEGYMTQEDNRMLIGGQHKTVSGYVHDTFNRDKDFWENLRFSSEDSPLADKGYCERISKKYGRNHDVYRVRVLGMAPRGNPEAFLSLEEVEAARTRWESIPMEGDLAIGLDPARYGDDLCVSTLRVGNKVMPQKWLEQSDSDDIANLVLSQLRTFRHDYPEFKSKVCEVRVLATGGYGTGAIDILSKNTTDNIVVVPVYETGKISVEESPDYYDGVTKMHGEVRDRIRFLGLPPAHVDEGSDFLLEELTTRQYEFVEGRIKIWSKKKYKKEYPEAGSPDRSDSLAACVARRAGINRVFSNYQSTDGECRRRFNIGWDDLINGEYKVYVVFHLSQDTSLSVAFFFWGRVSKRLYIYDELVFITPSPEIVAFSVSKKSIASVSKNASGPKVSTFFGNDAMFKGGKNFAYNLSHATPRIKVKENLHYDIMGAIAKTNQMFRDNKIIIHSKCENMDYHCRMWRIENRRPILGYDMCKTILTVISDLRAHGELTEIPEFKGYSRTKQKIMDKLRHDGELPTRKDMMRRSKNKRNVGNEYTC